MEFDADFGDGTVAWSATAGPTAGASGVEKVEAHEVAPGVYVVNWLEDSGTSVSQCINFNNGRIWNFVTYDAGGRRSALSQQGTITDK